jgi:hypothetical protein
VLTADGEVQGSGEGHEDQGILDALFDLFEGLFKFYKRKVNNPTANHKT